MQPELELELNRTRRHFFRDCGVGLGRITLASLLSHAGTLVMSLRHGPVPAGRRMFDVSGEETITIAGRYGLRPVLNVRCNSIQVANQALGVTWTRLAFRRSDD